MTQDVKNKEVKNLKQIISSNEDLIAMQSKLLKEIKEQNRRNKEQLTQKESLYVTLLNVVASKDRSNKKEQEETASDDKAQIDGKSVQLDQLTKKVVHLQHTLALTKLQLALRSQQLLVLSSLFQLNQFTQLRPKRYSNPDFAKYHREPSEEFSIYENRTSLQIDDSHQERTINKWNKQKIKQKAVNLMKKGIPHGMRGRIWMVLVQNKMNITNELQLQLQKRRDADWVNEKIKSQIKKDIVRSFYGAREMEMRTGLPEEVTQLLQLFYLHRPDIGYVQGMTYPAMILTLVLGKFNALLVLVNILAGNTFFLSLFTFHSIHSVCRSFQILLHQYSPTVAKKLTAMKISSEMYLVEWLYTFFSRSVSLKATLFFWDHLIFYGQLASFKLALSILTLIDFMINQANYEETIRIIHDYGSFVDERKLLYMLAHHELTQQKMQSALKKTEKINNWTSN